VIELPVILMGEEGMQDRIGTLGCFIASAST
jgi:hypothetical protein